MNTLATTQSMHTAPRGASLVAAWFVDSRPAAAGIAGNAAGGLTKPSNAAT